MAPDSAAPLILGAGPAGCAAAIALAREGLEPLLIDRDEHARDQLCGGFLSWRTAAQLRALGVEPAGLGARKVERLALISGRHEVALPLPEPVVGPVAARPRRRAEGGWRWQPGLAWKVEHARGVERLTVHGHRRDWTREGCFSPAGKHDLRGLTRPRTASDPALGLRLRLPASPQRESLLAGRIELHLFDHGYAGIVLQEDGTANVCLAVRKSLLARAGGEPAGLLAMLADAHPAFGRRLGNDWASEPVETVGSVPYGWIARSAAPGLFRLGDQAVVIPSLAGEGISIALASGEAAARHWLAHGPAGAASHQREMAARAAAPVRTARAAWWLAESPSAAALGIELAKRFPPVLRALVKLTRIEPEPMLAPRPTAA
jgi:flavin-dependent dehydrogenase